MRQFETSDLDEMNRWRAHHRMPPLSASQLPTFGVIEPGVLACFLYVTDSDLGFLDELISSPESTKPLRALALSEALGMLTTEATRRGLKRLMALPTTFAGTRATVAAGFRLETGVLVSKREL